MMVVPRTLSFLTSFLLSIVFFSPFLFVMRLTLLHFRRERCDYEMSGWIRRIAATCIMQAVNFLPLFLV